MELNKLTPRQALIYDALSVPIVTGDFGYMLVDENNPEPLLRYAKRLNAHGDEELATAAMAQQIYERLVTAR